MTEALLATFIVYFIFLIVHVLIFRLIEVKRRVLAMFSILMLSGLLWFPVEASLRVCKMAGAGVPLQAGVWVALLFTLIWFGYLQFWSAFDTSPSLRFLIEIMEHNGESMTFDELRAHYNFDDVFRRRIDRMAESRFLELDSQSHYRNSPKGQCIGRASSSVKYFLNLGEGG